MQRTVLSRMPSIRPKRRGTMPDHVRQYSTSPGRAQDLLRVPLLRGHDTDGEYGEYIEELEDERVDATVHTDDDEGQEDDQHARRETGTDYRSEGEQPSMARNGERTARNGERTDSFRAARMPKRGGRKRLRRVGPIRRKIRVSSYCVSRELQTLKLLKWLEVKPSRQLSLQLQAEGTTRHAIGGISDRVVRRSEKFVPDSSQMKEVEWMDSLYIDVLHSTTDLESGLHKARDFDRPAWKDDGEKGGGYATTDMDGVDDHKDVIFFPYGCVVFWGCSEAEEIETIEGLGPFIVGKVSEDELSASKDDMTFAYQSQKGRGIRIKNDEISLDTTDPTEKLAYSCALAQSAKLFVFEERLDHTIEITSKYPEVLAATGKIGLSEIEIGKLIGKVLCERNEVNLHSDILDTPELFWEEDRWEPAYEALCAYMDISQRVEVLNKRLDILGELLDVLSTQLTNAHATRLEVIIIYLILMEVAIELVWNVIIKDVLHLFED